MPLAIREISQTFLNELVVVVVWPRNEVMDCQSSLIGNFDSNSVVNGTTMLTRKLTLATTRTI